METRLLRLVRTLAEADLLFKIIIVMVRVLTEWRVYENKGPRIYTPQTVGTKQGPQEGAPELRKPPSGH